MNIISLEKCSQLPPPPANCTGWPWTEPGVLLPEMMSDGRSWPRVSIVTPSYNQGQFIEATMRSVLSQGYPNLEYIVIDGGSTDDSVDIIRKYDRWLTYWVSEPDRGQTHAINKGIAYATGEVFSWLNSDDFLLPGALERVAQAQCNNPEAVGWVGSCHLIAPDGRLLKTVTPYGLERDNLANWYYGGYIFQPACFIDAQAWYAVDGANEALRYAMDFDMWLRLAAIGDFASQAEPLAAAVIHESAKTQAQRPEMHLETMFVQMTHGYEETAVYRLNHLLKSASRQPRISKRIKSLLLTVLKKSNLTRNKNAPQIIQFAPNSQK